eukprot:CAMPEP_0184859622 /NCGR_PEP_ID=MMETSP0580-20130426/4612_1 /TAXON_ID=1118495 /ORGANISM="Dactyliosolen fragilissimus" /LENGTH=286 /DNA_ID=CAMNT_0027356369 /DNA_START=293 /DNA_END=1153 /DNA_ORIENTATION=+
MNFFKDLLDGAFANDPNLSADKSENQLEGPNDSLEGFLSPEKTDVQKKWLEQQSLQKSASKSKSPITPTSNTGYGAPMNPDLLKNTTWKLSLYLTGAPDFDPSSSLYGSRVNISSRNQSQMQKEGFAIGADQLPADPSVEITVNLLEDGSCATDPSSFTSGNKIGEWRLSDDCRLIRLSIDVNGFQRTVTTKGSIQNIYWSDRDSVQSKTSATYSIPPGWVYAEGPVGYGPKPGILIFADNSLNPKSSDIGPSGILKMESRTGLLGAGVKILSCGKFSGVMVTEDV